MSQQSFKWPISGQKSYSLDVTGFTDREQAGVNPNTKESKSNAETQTTDEQTAKPKELPKRESHPK